MQKISLEKLQTYRARTFRLHPGERLKAVEDAISFVNERGFIYFWPVKGIVLPSLWAAVAGDRPVADAHDDPGHVTWGWKDSLLGSKRWYYAKVLRKRATIISLETTPYFYALSENYGSPQEDYLIPYEQGRLTQESKLVYEALLTKGPLDTIALRRAARLSSPESESRFNRALTELQADFKVLPVGVTQAGGWRYAFTYDLLHRHFSELPELARPITENKARQELAWRYLLSVGAAQRSDLVKLFGWSPAQAERAANVLVQNNLLLQNVEILNLPGEWFAIPELME